MSRAVVCIWAALAFAQPTRQVVAVFADPPPPPPTFAALLERASLIVVGRVDAASVRAWGRGSVIDYRVAVLEVLREHSGRPSSSNITVAIAGGTITGGTGQPLRTHGPPQLEIGHIGIFVLSYWTAAEAYAPGLWGGYFELREDRGDVVTIPEGARHMPEFTGRTTIPRSEFSALVKMRRVTASR